MSKYIEYTVQDTRTGHTFKIQAKDNVDAIETVADFYELDIDYLKVV